MNELTRRFNQMAAEGNEIEPEEPEAVLTKAAGELYDQGAVDALNTLSSLVDGMAEVAFEDANNAEFKVIQFKKFIDTLREAYSLRQKAVAEPSDDGVPTQETAQ